MAASLIVSKKRILVYTKEDEDGSIKYYSYNTDKELKLCSYTHNFTTRSGIQITCLTYASYKSARNLLFPNLSVDSNVIGFLMPFDEFAKDKLGTNIDSISMQQANTLLKFYNLFNGQGKPFSLSFDVNESHKIIERQLRYKFEEKSQEQPKI